MPRSPLANAVLGAVASVALAFLPFSPLLGGAVAGYLQGSNSGAGVRVGALSGLVAALPVFAILALIAGFLPVFPSGVLALSVVALVLAVGFVTAYTVALAAVGGWLGAFLRRSA